MQGANNKNLLNDTIGTGKDSLMGCFSHYETDYLVRPRGVNNGHTPTAGP